MKPNSEATELTLAEQAAREIQRMVDLDIRMIDDAEALAAVIQRAIEPMDAEKHTLTDAVANAWEAIDEYKRAIEEMDAKFAHATAALEEKEAETWDKAIAIVQRHAGSCPGHTQIRMFAALEQAREGKET